MTLNIYLLFFALFFSLSLYVYILCVNEDGFSLAIKEDNKTNEVTANNLNAVNDAVNDSVTINTQDAFMDKQKKDLSIQLENKNENELNLKKYSQQLKRSINTLTYISVMEADSLTNKDHLKKLLNLKESVQYEIVRITKQINYYKSRIENSKPA